MLTPALCLPVALAQPVTDTHFSADRGFYDAPFKVAVTADAPEAVIRYTLDGSAPSPTHGFVYTDSIAIDSTMVLRALAYTPTDTTNVDTHTYLFLDQMVRQPADMPGYPRNEYFTGSGFSTVRHDYEMDPHVVDDPAYSSLMIDAMKAVPTVSLVMHRDDFWAVNDGNAERPVSVEVLYPDDPTMHEQEDGGLEGHSHIRLKRSFRLVFKAEYGAGKWTSNLMRNAPLNGAGATTTFDRLVLRAASNASWARHFGPDRTAYTRDQWYRDSQLAVSGKGARGTFVHLYVNGLYWGLYNPVERPDRWFTSAYFGGDEADWFAVSHGGAMGGDEARYAYLTESLLNQDLSNPARYAEMAAYLDLESFIDYLIVTWMTGMTDWPGNNFWGGNRTSPPEPFLYFGWDGEWAWDLARGSNAGAWVHPDFRANRSGGPAVTALWHALRKNPAFMRLFADRVYRHLFNDGPLTDENSRARWAVLNDFIRDAVLGESARWGDALGPLRERDVQWQAEVDRLDGLMDGNAGRFLAALRAEGYYPAVDPPEFSRHGGPIPAGFQLALTNPNPCGSIHFTLNGQDPAEPEAVPYTEPVTLGGVVTVRARVRHGSMWSALHEATFYGPQDLGALVINELMYHPPVFNGEDGDSFEFIEGGPVPFSRSVAPGWVLLGGPEVPVPVASIASTPPGIIASPFYAFDGAWAEVAMLMPGAAVWVKVNAPGSLWLGNAESRP